MRLSRIEKMQRESLAEPEHRVVTQWDEVAAALLGKPPLPTQRAFMYAPDRVAWYTGPVGTGKTSILAATVALHAMLLPASRWFIGRFVGWTLEATTLKVFETMCARLGKNTVIDRAAGPPYTMWIASALRNAHGQPCEPSEVHFHSLDDPNKVNSLEYNGIFVDEANEIDERMATALNLRCRYQGGKWPGAENGPFLLRFVSNPVTHSHWLHRKFCGEEECEQPPWGRKFRATKEENIYLPPGYYEEASKGLSPEQILRFIEGECGPDPTDSPVFRSVFKSELHVVRAADFKWNTNRIGFRGHDFGRRRPALVIAQQDDKGRLVRHAAHLGDNVSLTVWMERIRNFSEVHFPGTKEWREYVDPHGNAVREMDDRSPVQRMREEGFDVHFRDVSVSTGLDTMTEGLTRLVDGRPRSLFTDSPLTLHLRTAYSTGYVWPRARASGRVSDRPLADGFYEHLMDADRYLEVGLHYREDKSGKRPPKSVRKRLR